MFDQFAQLYEECMKVSPALTSPTVDEMELWEVAVALGRALPSDDQHAPPAPATPQSQPPLDESTAMKRYEAIQRRRAGLPELPEEEDRPQALDPSLATLIATNAPERLR